ncbi:MAG: hypothetical protein V7731_22360 [Amphritea sp.]
MSPPVEVELAKAASQTMLTSDIYQAYCEGVNKLKDSPAVTQVGSGAKGQDENQGQAGSR